MLSRKTCFIASGLCVVLAALLHGAAADRAEDAATTFNVKFSDPRPQASGPPVQDDLTYQVMHTIKGSYAAIGPLECESSCTVREPKPTCAHDVPPCALDCAKDCAKGSNEVSLFERICLDGCMLFCEFLAPPKLAGTGAAVFKNDQNKSRGCTKGQLCP